MKRRAFHFTRFTGKPPKPWRTNQETFFGKSFTAAETALRPFENTVLLVTGISVARTSRFFRRSERSFASSYGNRTRVPPGLSDALRTRLGCVRAPLIKLRNVDAQSKPIINSRRTFSALELDPRRGSSRPCPSYALGSSRSIDRFSNTQSPSSLAYLLIITATRVPIARHTFVNVDVPYN